MAIMNQLSIAIALCLPAPDIEALNQGRNILVMPPRFMHLGERFALYPTDIEFNSLPLEQYYRPGFIPIAKQSIAELNQDKVKIKVWAKCELCQTLDKPEELETLSKLTVWTAEGLHKTLEQRGHIFLAYFRVYRLPQPLEIDPVSNSRFISLPHSIMVDESQAILDDNNFERQYRKILNRQPPEHPELEELENAIAQYPNDNLSQKEQIGLQQLKANIHYFLGWKTASSLNSNQVDLNWINTITTLGNRSKEQDEGKTNYQAGTDFENIVKQSLEFLGFTIDYAHKGGAGGLDLFCSQPYPLVGECKAGRKIPNPTVVQLLNLGTLRLKDENLFKQAAKLIIGPGELTPAVRDAAKVHGMAIINPMTLEKLVKLQAQYPGSVNLIELKNYLQAGQIDDKIDEYIETVIKDLKLRSHIIKVVKDYLNNAQMTEATVSGIHGLYCSNPPQPLPQKQLHEILVELSSPLAGYLGRNRADDWRNDSFYYLRELIVDQSQGFD
ncbi:DUF1802 family protein [Planktothrix agardhii]|uniref:DUF1802 family protein n=1 Tax=Planktothrix agardhii TaxID=1160 RepID=UPI001D09C0A6|nr:DUF1802 family protein [Planktothrix agardhii]MCB8786427.1 DUF1802 family protein [Planktothrix agardhii 1025]MCF3611930.1 DUF1802 family protein [Planktothrix agardhii 1027]MCF3645705.1 DUF1802 family protein [Planktothrix agardhii 1026]CAD5910367.1 hypothetical protein NO2A_00381 [Planktothrix agardhii]